MTGNTTRQELGDRFAKLLREDNAALSLLQLLEADTKRGASLGADSWTGPFAALAEDFASLKGQQPAKRSVGIWEEDEATGDFVRAERHLDLWRFCANVERIGKKGDKKRIVLLGESVARGFFFDPVYSPAKVLSEQLSAFGSPVEVIDLAQSNCDPWWLSKIAASVPLLEPDAVVVFGGNNWRVGALANTSVESFIADGELITDRNGFSTLLKKQLQRLEQFAQHVITQVAAPLTPLGVPVVFVIPEINVADWTNAPAGALDVPLMSTEDTQNWVSAYRSSAKALDDGDAKEAEQHVRHAISLDGGTSSSSLDQLARIQHALAARPQDIYRTLRESRDIIEDTRVVPGIFAVVAETIRVAAPRAGATIVDLPQLFGDRYEHAIPGRHLYLDFCHHTSEGMRVAMAAVAQKLLPALFMKEARLDELIEAASKPAPEHEAWAHVLAGIHNAHWGQPAEICRHHFKQAREYFPAIAQTGVKLVYEAYRRKTPPVLLPEFDQLVRNDIAEVCLVGYSPLARGVIKEQALLESIAAVFPEIAAASEGSELALDDSEEVDLLQSHSTELTDRNRWYRRAYMAAYGTRTAYTFSCNSSKDLEIAITTRIPEAMEPGDIKLSLNGTRIAQTTIEADWVTLRVTATAGAVRRGLNELAIEWPNVPRRDVRERLRRDFEAGQKVDIRTQFGQLHDLRVATLV